MKIISTIKKIVIISALSILVINKAHSQSSIGNTEITKWQDGKKGAVSITYDDGTINQFRVAVPIMNRLNLPGTFFINTSSIPGSKYQGKFIGRPVSEIINESKTIPTNRENVFERASAARYLGYRGTGDYFTRAGAQIDANRYEEAYKILDELYKKVVDGELQTVSTETSPRNSENILTWEMVKTHAAEGHEFASHMVTHPYASALDEPNLLYELEKSREEILEKLGIRHTISVECPYGTVDERAVQYAANIYPSSRNGILEDYLMELHRPSRRSPVNNNFEYVQWQRGLITRTTLSEMNAWVDTTALQNNIWLVLVVHGIDGIGWESLKKEDVDAHYSYIKSRENDVWVATFGDVTRYIKERMNAKLKSSQKGKNIKVTLTHSLDKKLFDLPLTLKTYVNPEWKEATVKQKKSVSKVKVQREGSLAFVTYRAMPDDGTVSISEAK